MERKAEIIRRFISDALILGGGGIILLLFKVAGSPFHRGFFCDDESLMHPFHESTITSLMLYGIGFLLFIVLMLIIETVHIYYGHTCPTKQLEIEKHGKLPVLIKNSYLAFVSFCFGAVIEHLTTDIGKYGVGRLRPHFFSVCHLNMSMIDCKKGYIEDYECTGDADQIREVRLSFPSGHASFSTFVAVYMMIYLQRRMTFFFPSLIRPFIQMVIFCMAWYTCLSRISDYKHHWSDVLGGIVVGTVAGVLVAYFVSDLFKDEIPKVKPKSHYTTMNKGDTSEIATASENPIQGNNPREVTVM